MPSEATTIRNGIEWYDDRSCQCARCGSTAEFLDCTRCGGEGIIDTDDWQDFEDDDQLCPECGGTGGSWHCVSAPDWCEAHPMADREHIRSTALSAHAWND